LTASPDWLAHCSAENRFPGGIVVQRVTESENSRRRRRQRVIIVAIVIFAMLATALAGVVAAFAGV